MFCIFFFTDTATTEIYTLSLHDALPICRLGVGPGVADPGRREEAREARVDDDHEGRSVHLVEMGAAERCEVRKRSEEHTSELQSRLHLVCRLLLEKKKKNTSKRTV